MGGSSESDDNVHVSLPRSVFISVFTVAVLGGAGLYGTIGPQLDKAAITSCIDNSRIAIDVAAQHGAEIQILRQLIYERTADRYTSQDANRFQAESLRWHDRVSDRLDRLEARE